MKNPWTKKNPFMSMWLSGANAVFGRARGTATAAVKREASDTLSAVTRAGARQVADFWVNALTAPASTRKRRKKR